MRLTIIEKQILLQDHCFCVKVIIERCNIEYKMSLRYQHRHEEEISGTSQLESRNISGNDAEGELEARTSERNTVSQQQQSLPHETNHEDALPQHQMVLDESHVSNDRTRLTTGETEENDENMCSSSCERASDEIKICCGLLIDGCCCPCKLLGLMIDGMVNATRRFYNKHPYLCTCLCILIPFCLLLLLCAMSGTRN